MNVGSIVRAMGNFGFLDLRIVNPKCSLDLDAVKYAKHSAKILQDAKICPNFEDAIKDCEMVIGTTGIRKRNKDTIRSVVTLKEFEKRIMKKMYKRKVALVFGREGIGLNAKEISACDMLIHIEGNPNYPILNLSHAFAIIAYIIAREKQNIQTDQIMNKKEKETILKYTKDICEKINHRRKEGVVLATKRIISKSTTSSLEAGFLISFLKEIKKQIEKNNKK